MPDRLTPEALTSFLASFSPDAQTLARAARGRLLDIFPDAMETAEGKDLGYGFDRGYKGLVFTVNLKKRAVNIGVARGASMEDPDGLLTGSGKLHRHIEILDAKLLDDARYIRLLRRALESRQAPTRAPG
jgi:hypothetical protein